MGSQVLVPFLVTVCKAATSALRQRAGKGKRTVFWDVVEVVPPDDDCAGHLRRDNLARQDTATNRDVTSERALFVCGELNKPQVYDSSRRTNVCAANGLCGGLEPQADILVPALLLGGDLLAA